MPQPQSNHDATMRSLHVETSLKSEHAFSNFLIEITTATQHCWCNHGNRIKLDNYGILSSRCWLCNQRELMKCWETFVTSPVCPPDWVLLILAGIIRHGENTANNNITALLTLTRMTHSLVRGLLNKDVYGLPV